MTTQISEVNVQQFKNAVMFSIQIRRWGNRAQVRQPEALVDYLDQLQREERTVAELAAARGEAPEPSTPAVDNIPNLPRRVQAAKKRLNISKSLVQCPQLDALNDRLNKAKRDALKLSMPSFVKSGMFAVSKELIETVDGILQRAQTDVQENYLPAFLIAFPDAKENAKSAPLLKGGLGPIYLESDYPASDSLSDKFQMNWNWLSLTLPEDALPAALRQREADKLSRIYSDAGQEIKNALRMMFQELLEHATDRLRTEPGKDAKVFRNSMITNISDFFDTFPARNLMDDAELAAVVTQCKEVMAGVTPDVLRKDMGVRDATLTKLAEIKALVDPMIETEGRSFDFDSDEEA